MTDIVFATCNEQPEIQPSDRLLAGALEARSVSVTAAPWNGPQEPFRNTCAVLLRSTWDYQKTPDKFLDWLVALEARRHVFNSPALMRWNASKRYLIPLAEAGAPVVPTKLVEPTAEAIAAAMDDLGLSAAVTKPEFGATSSGLSVVERDDPTSLAKAAEALEMPGLVQPVISEITERGETSMMFVDGVFSHAVCKRPKHGDIRSQPDFGGAVTPVDPSPWAIKAAQEVLAMVPEPALYARVDAVLLDDHMQLMELELIEPELFFTYAPKAEIGAADRFAAALLKRL